MANCDSTSMDDPITLMDQRPTRADALKNHDLLLETAARLFSEQGVAAVSMSAVAQAAGVGKGTLYRHFPNKEALCMALLDAQQRDLQERTLERLRHNTCAADNLRWFMAETAAFVMHHTEILAPGGDGLLEHPAHAWWRHTIRALLGAVQREQGRAAQFDADYSADVLYMMLSVRAIHFQRSIMHYAPQRIVDGLIYTANRLIQP